jgi:hypothetical protein
MMEKMTQEEWNDHLVEDTDLGTVYRPPYANISYPIAPENENVGIAAKDIDRED